ncbi:MAG: cytochrome c family protein, partial [Chromatiales bacterium]|nr:cytochrome c family protein [Chromatiales bacterium]
DMTPITASDVWREPYIAQAYDEPLEDAIRASGDKFPSGKSDMEGRFAISDIPDGKYYIHVTPAPGDVTHLPGGDKSRESYDAEELRNGMMKIAISSRPSAEAHYVGSTACLECHDDHASWQKTGHKLAWSVPGKPGPAQDFSRFPNWFNALKAWKQADTYTEGTKLELGDYNPRAKGAVKFVVRQEDDERLPIEKIYGDVYLWKNSGDGRYYITIENKLNTKDPNSPAHLPVELLYGGGVHRQRFIVSVPEKMGKRQGLYTVLQFNPDGNDNRLDIKRRVWRDYKFSYWWNKGEDGEYGTSDDVLKAPPVNNNSVQSMCAGCHVTGVERYTDSKSGQILVRGVNDPNGAFNIDDDPQPDEINIGCESCHGPGSEHIDNAGISDLLDMAIVNPALLSAERASVVCGRCHDRRHGVGGWEVAYTQPLSAQGEIMKPGGSRHELITTYSKTSGPIPGKEIWPDDIHSKNPHQQYPDFMKSVMYRNDRQMVTCFDCHDMHGDTPYRRWLTHDPDDASSPLCQRCHEVEILTHMERQLNNKMKGLVTSCIQCHMPGTMVTGGDAGHYGRMIKLPEYEDAKDESKHAYWEGHINSHVFDVPQKTNVGVWGVEPGKAMPIPYTATCGVCHSVAELPHK